MMKHHVLARLNPGSSDGRPRWMPARRLGVAIRCQLKALLPVGFGSSSCVGAGQPLR